MLLENDVALSHPYTLTLSPSHSHMVCVWWFGREGGGSGFFLFIFYTLNMFFDTLSPSHPPTHQMPVGPVELQPADVEKMLRPLPKFEGLRLDGDNIHRGQGNYKVSR